MKERDKNFGWPHLQHTPATKRWHLHTQVEDYQKPVGSRAGFRGDRACTNTWENGLFFYIYIYWLTFESDFNYLPLKKLTEIRWIFHDKRVIKKVTDRHFVLRLLLLWLGRFWLTLGSVSLKVSWLVGSKTSFVCNLY